MILQDIVNALDKFLPSANIEIDKVPQNLEKETFLVQGINVEIEREFRNRYWYSLLFNITYVPSKNTSQFELEKVRTGLLFALEEIGLSSGGYARSSNIAGKIQDTAVIITVSYRLYIEKYIEPELFMEKLYQDFNLKRSD